MCDCTCMLLTAHCSFESSLRVLDFPSSTSSTARLSQDDNLRWSRKRSHDSVASAPAPLTTDSCAVAVPSAGTEGIGASPYPSVDQFITGQLNKGGIQGSIRRWTFFPIGGC